MLTHRKIILWTGGVVLLALIFPSIFRIVFAAKNEVSYSAGLSATTCSGFLANGYSSPESCRANYAIILGNTGTVVQDEIQVTLSPIPETWLLGTGVMDIVASARQRQQPGINHEQQGELLKITITHLEPNRLVELDMITRGAEAAELLSSTEIQIDASGAVIESNPRLTVVARFFRNLLSLGL